ncbi:hypothetical protein F6X42_04345 [Paraburkholderia sp. WC7.3b]|uniref:C2H2-type domain-containing protein n=1 Tax=Paraburkholderia podalyriae TaxID=1938811 RepID=A0ABR7PHM7_9BURK|nr:hypothetical protein [Paraburkholderia podalyriae]
MTLKKTGAEASVFFSPVGCPPQISRCKKIFCVVKNHVAKHKKSHCNREDIVSYRETKTSSH